ncbi:hypothetical protein N9C06_02950 [Salibacteraceae bacterium]|jgi:hypothetical protein|nr:hypothetical protein [Salibacteraceae bacterium]
MRRTQLVLCLFSILTSACNKGEDRSFSSWYEARYEKSACLESLPEARTFTTFSDSLLVDSIYRSMMGPYERKNFEIESSDSLIWIVGYEVEVLGSDSASAQFLCHSNLNLQEAKKLPWSSNFESYNSRVFTLSQGIDSVRFPIGFGIPLPGTQVFELVSQVLNDNIRPVNAQVQHRIKLHYYNESDLECALRPLDQQAIFIFKQYEGPQGLFGQEANKVDRLRQPSCGFEEVIIADSSAPFNQFHDPQGRRFTGHWKVFPGEERIKMDITQLLKPKDEVFIHFILCHVHPFCEELILRDETEGRELYRSNIQSYAEGIGLIQVPFYSSREGLELKEGHLYSFESYYNNRSSDTLSAMSVMYTYTSVH